jgi:hypothetical protein
MTASWSLFQALSASGAKREKRSGSKRLSELAGVNVNKPGAVGTGFAITMESGGKTTNSMEWSVFEDAKDVVFYELLNGDWNVGSNLHQQRSTKLESRMVLARDLKVFSEAL